jgi:hypothetical protein
VPDLVVVPTPLRKSRAERRLCDAQGGLLLGARVSTLAHLAPGLLAGAGDRRALLPALAERIVALLSARDAGLLGGASPSGGAGRAAVRLLSELRSAEVAPGDLRAAADGAPDRVAERLLVAAGALAAYEDRLSSRHALDAAGALRAAASAAERGSRSEETDDLGLLVLEGLLPTSPAALDLGAALVARARRTRAVLPFLPDEAPRSGPAEPWMRRIESLHELAARRDVEISLPATGRVPPRVLGLPAPDGESQCDAAARLAANLLEEGLAPSELLVLAPRRLLEPLPAAFERLGVPLAAPASRLLATVPLVRDVRAALGSAGGLDRTGLLSLLASPWLGPVDPPGGLRILLDRAGVLDGRGSAVERLRARAAVLARAGRAGWERAGLLRAARSARRLERSVAPLREAATPSAWAARFRAFLEREGLRRRAGRGDPSIARRDLAAIARLEEIADELARALALAGLGSTRLPPEEILQLLDVALDRAELPWGQGPAAGAVEAWPIEEAPGLTARAAIVLGADRGTWPGTMPVDPLIGNAGRERLQASMGRRALATAFHRRAEADFRGLWALAAASEVLAVAWTRGPEEEEPAPLAARALDLAGAERLALGVDPPLARARAEGEALRAAARLARAGREEEAEGALVGLPGLLGRAGDVALRGAQERERRDAWTEGRASPAAGELPPGMAAWRDALPGEWSPTDLETHATCPYRFLLGRAGVREAGTGDLDMEPRDEGALLHDVLEAFVRDRIERGAWPPREGDRDEARRIAGDVLARFEAQGRVGDPATWSARSEAVLRRLDRFVADEARGDAGLRPVLLEHDFGAGKASPPLAIPDGDGAVLVAGRIDRVDADEGRLRVLDYKNSRSAQRYRDRLRPEALGRTSFQAPLYLLAAARDLPGRSVLEAGFVLLRSGERPRPWATTPGDPVLALDPARRAAIRAEGGTTVADGVVDAVARIRSGRFPVTPESCTGCPYGAVCRFPEPGEA